MLSKEDSNTDTSSRMAYTDYFPTCTQVVLGGILVLVVTVHTWIEIVRKKYPPGPHPIFSNLLFTFSFLEKLLQKCKRTYGNVVTIYAGMKPVVFLSNYDVIHQAFVGQADYFSSRPTGFGKLITGAEDAGIVCSSNWKEQRKFTLSVLRDYGMGKIDMERKILEEVHIFTSQIGKNCGLPLDIEVHVHKAVSNVICNVIFGSRFEYADPEFSLLIDVLHAQSRHFLKMRLVEDLPVLQMLPGDIFGYHSYAAKSKRNLEYFAAAVERHEAQLDPEHTRDFIDAYLVAMRMTSADGSRRTFDKTNLLAIITELFIAGTDTTSSVLRWAWLFVIMYPEIQKKIQEEIDTCVGNRPPSLNDKLRMPYTEAVLTEVMRIGNTALSTLLHKVDRSVSIDGHTIPKDTRVQAFLMDVHTDENNYPEPDEFNPGRYLDENGKFVKPLKFVPFGIGRRMCLGESLARAELFLFFTSVLQRFNLKASEGAQLSTHGERSFLRNPKQYDILFTER